MANAPVPFYYNQYTAKERSYVNYMGEINKSLSSDIHENTNRQIAADAMFAEEIKSTLISNQIATEKALYNHTQQIDGTLTAGFSDMSNQLQTGLSGISRELGFMSSAINIGFAFLNSAVQASTKAICEKLDDIHETLKNPLYTESRELYNRALQNYNKRLFKEALEDLRKAIKKNPTDPFSYFLLGQTYLYGISKYDNVIDLNAAIESLINAAKYIEHDAGNTPTGSGNQSVAKNPARLLAAEIWFYLGLAYHNKANDDLHHSNKSDYKKLLNEAKAAYTESWNYSNNMLESLYNIARCKTLTNDEDGAIQDLKVVIVNDHGYCIKSYTEADFNNAFKEKLFSQLKKDLYQKTKDVFDRIKTIKTDFQGPYSDNLTQLICRYLPNTFTEKMPPFDILKASVNLPAILFILEKEQRDHTGKRRDKERLNDIRKKISKLKDCIATSHNRTVCLRTDGTVIMVGDENFKNEWSTDGWRNVVAIYDRALHILGLKSDGTVVAVGNTAEGQCNTKGWKNIVAISAGNFHSVGLKSDGTVVAVGSNKYGECNTNGWQDIAAIFTGNFHTLGLKTDGTVVAVGLNDDDQCNVKDWNNIVTITAGFNYTAGLKSDGTVVAVGSNYQDMCNTGGWQNIVDITAGEHHIVGLKSDGTVVTVGDDMYDQCKTLEWRDIAAIFAGYYHTVGLKSDGTVVAAGKKDEGQCNVKDWNDILMISTGPYHTVGLKSDSTVVAVGTNSNGQCNTDGFRNIGLANKELLLKRAQEDEQRKREKEEQQSNSWKQQGLCQYCGGTISGVFTKKCKSCGKT
ncbi:MAG: hypothetical protein FWD87_08885 [Spirochaetaceae bacterium]|nr:hypothetical protein [Spirochaetaceae bacterium]